MSYKHSISVRGETAGRIAVAADAAGSSMSAIVEAATSDLPTDPVEIAALADRVWARMSPAARGKHTGG